MINMDDEVLIGKYAISNCPHGGFWLCKEGGEGMQVINEASVKHLEQLLDQFWEDEF